MSTIKSRWLPLREFCTKYALSVRTIRRYCKEGHIPAKLEKTNWYIDSWMWEEMVEEHLSMEDLIEDISVEDSVVNECGMSIVGSRWIAKKLL